MGVTPWPESTPPYYLVAFFFPATVRFGPCGCGRGLGALTAHRKSLTVTLALVAVDLDLATDVRVDFTTQIALDLVIAFEVITQRNQLLIRQILDANIRVDTGRGKRFLGTSATYTENIGEGDLDALLIGDVDSGKTCHCDSFCVHAGRAPSLPVPRPGPAYPGFSCSL